MGVMSRRSKKCLENDSWLGGSRLFVARTAKTNCSKNDGSSTSIMSPVKLVPILITRFNHACQAA